MEAIMGVALLLLAAAAAPSFDCARARGAVEQAICASAALAELDREEARLYRLARAVPQARREALRDRQRAFLAERDSCPSPPSRSPSACAPPTSATSPSCAASPASPTTTRACRSAPTGSPATAATPTSTSRCS
jgi:uncharacterized protein YecT (DUF1311 family)